MNTRAELWSFENQQSAESMRRMKEINEHVDGSIGAFDERSFCQKYIRLPLLEMNSDLDHRVPLGVCFPSSILATDR